MSTRFRNTVGAPDAEHFVAVHQARAATDGVDPNDPEEYYPNLEYYREMIASSDPKDWLVAEHDGEVIAYGQTLWNWGERDGTEVYLHCGFVEPAFRGKGVGTALLEKLELRCREKAEEAGRQANLEIAANASGTELAAQELLKHRGYYVVFNMLGMELAGDTVLQTPAIPEGYELRAAKPEHHLMIWQSIGDAYDARNRGNERFGEAVRKERYRSYFSGDPSLIFVAWELQSERIAGQVLCTILDNGAAEVFEVSVGLGHQRKGLGRFLLLNALQELRSRGVELITLGTREENPTEAWRLYEKVGFRPSKDFLRWRKKRA